MTISVTISDAAKARADALVLSGRYESIEQAIEAGLHYLQEGWIDEVVDLDDLSPEDRAAVEEGLADSEAGRVIPADDVFDRLIAKYTAMADQR
jgi:antitoxin ParD1/3/4